MSLTTDLSDCTLIGMAILDGYIYCVGGYEGNNRSSTAGMDSLIFISLYMIFLSTFMWYL